MLPWMKPKSSAKAHTFKKKCLHPLGVIHVPWRSKGTGRKDVTAYIVSRSRNAFQQILSYSLRIFAGLGWKHVFSEPNNF